ncbi:catalase, partial [Sporosarcina sp. P2]
MWSFRQADIEYGRLVEEGIKQKMKELEGVAAEPNVPGREAGQSKFG